MRGLTGANGELPIIQYWHSEDVPEDVAATIASFRDQNPDLRHMLFDEARAEAFIEERFSARELAAFRACAVPAMQADYLRYCAVLALGGIYADVDLVCKRPLRELLEPGDEGVLVGPVGRRLPGGTAFFMFTSAGHPLLRLVLDISTHNIEHRVDERIVFLTGPPVMQCMWLVHKHGSFEDASQAAPGARARRLIDAIAQAVGDSARITAAFERVRISPLEHVSQWISGRRRLHYKRSESHWTVWQGGDRAIFR